MNRLARKLAFLVLALPWWPAQAADAPFLWEVQGAEATHYLMGSVHLLPPSAYPLHPALEQAYAATTGLVLETDLSAVGAPKAQRRMLAAGRAVRPIAEEIGPELHERLQARIASLQVNESLCEELKPWFCALSISVLAFQRAGMSPDRGLDAHFYRRALDDGRPLLWLEAPEQQIALFADMTPQMGLHFLHSAIEELESPQRGPEALIRYWQENDLEGMAGLVAEMHEDHPELHARVLADRNRAWLPRLTTLFKAKEPQLVIVGAAHFVGPDGLLVLLPQHGVRLVAVKDGPPEKVRHEPAALP